MVNEVAAKLEAYLATAVKEGKVPQAIVYATNADGSFEYHHSAGYQHHGIDDEPVHENPILMLASMTKLLTAITSLKMVELDYIGLDDDVTPHLPELAAKKIITGFDDDDDRPIFRDRKNPITIRHLLTHTSGLNYGYTHPLITKLRAQQAASAAAASAAEETTTSPPPTQPLGTVASRFDAPLTFEPGEGWTYSPGHDFAGLAVRRLTSLDLEAFAARHLWGPLGISDDITFWPAGRGGGFEGRIPTLVERSSAVAVGGRGGGGGGKGEGGEGGEGGGLLPHTGPSINTGATEPHGGQGGYASPKAYLAVLRSLLADDGRVLGAEGVRELFRGQMNDAGREGLRVFRDTMGGMVPGEQPTHIAVDHGLGGLVYLEDDEQRRRKGTLSWGGMVNTFWLIDREADLALVFGTQVLPSGDAGCKEVTGVVERAVYEMVGKV